jgi:uncharacterized membrane protein YfcA
LIHVFSFEFTTVQLITFFFVAVLIGMSKTGVHGAGMIAVPLLAAVFGGQLSTGIILPLLCIADVMGVWYYHRHTSWYHLRKLFPWAMLGTVIGTYVGGIIDDESFKILMAIIVVGSVFIMVWLERGNKKNVPDHPVFAATTGIFGGFTSMVGNLAGSVMAVYFMSIRFPKNEFIGTSAWFFMVMNWIKVPFHVFAWKTINANTFLLDLSMLPLIALGAFLGILIVKNLQEKVYRRVIIGITLIAAVMMVVK